jgi:copper chaperone CopZ
MQFNFKVQNLKCGGCANSITKKLSAIEDVNSVEVEAETSLVQINTSNPNLESSLKETLLHLGYPVEGDKNHFGSKAKSFISCATGRMSN